MKLRLPLVLISAVCLASSLPAQDPAKPKAPGAQQTSAHGVSFEYPGELRQTATTDTTGSQYQLKPAAGQPSLLVQIYSTDITPEKALELNLRKNRELKNSRNSRFSERAVQETIAGQPCAGKEFRYLVKGVPVQQRFFTLAVNNRTVLVMTLGRLSDDDVTRKHFAPVLASLH